MVETIHNDYEVSSEGCVRHLEVPYARLAHMSPMETNAAQVNGLLLGHELTGTILTIDAVRHVAVIDFTVGMVYRHDVRNCTAYAGGESAWALVNIGDPVYYDDTPALAAAFLFLSTSPQSTNGDANPLFGFVVASDPVDMAAFLPAGKGIAIAPGSTLRLAVMQCGAGTW